MIKEIVNDKESIYVYDEYDELIESNKYMEDTLVVTTYKHDAFGNQIENSSSNGKKTYTYNDKNQIESIDTTKGKIAFNYDDNGNVTKKVNEDGRVDLYTYNEFNQLTKLDQEQYIYEYSYDGEEERIKQVRTDTKDYHYDQWYDYSEPLDVVGNKEIKDTFTNLKQQVNKKEKNGNTCTSIVSDSYDGEKQNIASKNKYIYTLNNPYKYVDRSGNEVDGAGHNDKLDKPCFI